MKSTSRTGCFGFADQVRADLSAHYPSLHLVVEGGLAEVRGSFPVLGKGDRVLDRFQIRITLPKRYPQSLPIVREVGGRIPWTPERHIEPSGIACILLPDERWRVFPVGASFREYLQGPLHNFFLSQLAVEDGQPWPFGEWRHGADGILQFYNELLGVDQPQVVMRYLHLLSRRRINGHRPCPCGSQRRLRDCCLGQVQALRAKIDPTTAARSSAMIREALLKPATLPPSIEQAKHVPRVWQVTWVAGGTSRREAA